MRPIPTSRVALAYFVGAALVTPVLLWSSLLIGQQTKDELGLWLLAAYFLFQGFFLLLAFELTLVIFFHTLSYRGTWLEAVFALSVGVLSAFAIWFSASRLGDWSIVPLILMVGAISALASSLAGRLTSQRIQNVED